MKHPASVEEFKKKKERNVCDKCKLKFLNGRMYKAHMAKHHAHLWKQMQQTEKVTG